MGARRRDPGGGRARRALRRLAGHGAQGDRRARRREPARAPAGQGNVRRDAHRGDSVELPLPAHPPQRRPAASIPAAGSSTCGAARRAPRSRGCSRSSRATAYSSCAAILEYARRAGGARRDHAARGAVRRPDARALRRVSAARCTASSKRQFGVRMLRARGAAARGGRRCGERQSCCGVAPGTPLLAVDRVTFTYGDRPVEVRRGLCTTRHEHYWNALDLTGVRYRRRRRTRVSALRRRVRRRGSPHARRL